MFDEKTRQNLRYPKKEAICQMPKDTDRQKMDLGLTEKLHQRRFVINI